MDRLQSYGHVREVDAEARRVRVVVSTGNVARDEMVIEQRGWEFGNYDRNPVVLWAHDDRQLPIARAVVSERIITDNELIETHEFASHPRAQEVFDLVRGGFVNATSVRWLPIDWRFEKIDGAERVVFTRQELLEASYVSIPADPAALVLRADGGRLDLSQFRPIPAPEPVEQPDPRIARAAAIRGITQSLRG